jgi:hypothetical protein
MKMAAPKSIPLKLVDIRGLPFRKGDDVVKAASYSAVYWMLELKKVSRVENGRVYLEGSAQPLKFPERLAILGRRK